jgi:D-alanyl-D-alanine endopeptidase (penicillin-binding protein 7)
MNTNRLVRAGAYPVLGGKTGYTEAASYCLIVAARVEGRSLAMALLGSHGKDTRFADFGRVASWFKSQVGDEVPTTARTGAPVEGTAR